VIFQGQKMRAATGSEGSGGVGRHRTRGSRIFRRYVASTQGIAAVEFALLLPLLLLILFGIMDLGSAIVIKSKVRTAASTVAEIANQYTAIHNSDVNAILGAAAAIITPYPVSNVSVVLSQIIIDGSGRATVSWSDAQNGSARAVGSSFTVPSGIAVANTVLLLGEVSYNYTPAFGYAVIGGMALQDGLYATPRSGSSITRSP
jgi:Flp pilus assembly protein TadG